MKNTLLAAAVLTAFVCGMYTALILFSTGPQAPSSPQASAGPDLKFVPPLEWIEQRSKSSTESTTQTSPPGAKRPVFHVKSDAPKVRIFQTGYKGGSQITFNHEHHVKDLGLECIDCHHVESCSKCHTRDRENTMIVTRGKQALHESCLACHASSGGPQKCDECHKQ